MKVLIVHDRSEVAEAIKDVCVESGLESRLVDVCFDGTSARRSLSSTLYDLLIIDLTLPHILGNDLPTYQVADLLLKEIFLLDDIKTPGDIIGITRDEDALGLVATSVGPHVMTVIEEDGAGEWRAKLCEKVQYVLRASKTRQFSVNAQPDYDCLLITALDIEMAPLRERYEFSPYEWYSGAFTFGFNDKNGVLRRGAAYSIGKSGEARAASFTQSLLSIFRPKLLIMTGICGGVPDKVSLGDVVFADAAIDWDYGKWEEPQDGDQAETRPEVDPPENKEQQAPIFVSRPSPVSIEGTRAHSLLRELIISDQLRAPSLVREVSRMTEGKIKAVRAHLAPMASGSAVIASDAILGRVRGLNDAIRGVDMECFGLYHAASTTHVVKPEFLCVKAVSDFANGMKNDDWHVACSSLSALLGSMVMEEWRYAA